MAFQLSLLAFGPAGWAACAVVTVVLLAGAAGVFDQGEVHENDYNEEGVYVPEPHVEEEVPVINPTADISPEEQWREDQRKMESVLPYSYVLVYMSHPEEEPDPDPDFEDMRPPSSSFGIGAEAYDSGIGMIIAAIMCFAVTFWFVREFVEARQ